MNKHEQRAIQSYGKIADTYDDSFEGKFTLQFNNKLVDMVTVFVWFVLLCLVLITFK